MKLHPLHPPFGSSSVWLGWIAAWLLFKFVLLAQANPSPALPPAVVPGSLDPNFPPALAVGDVKTILRQADGKVLAGGKFYTTGPLLRNHLARFHPDGSVDASFAPDPALVPPLTALALQPDGKVLAGFKEEGLVRFLADGRRDDSFHPELANAPGIFGFWVMALAVQPNGRVLVSGRAHYAGASDDYWLSPQLFGLLADGSRDLSFSPFHDQVETMALLPDGGILVAGDTMARLNPDGAVDPGFEATVTSVYTLALQPDGGILIGGEFDSVNGQPRSCLARLLPNGALDLAFDPASGATGGDPEVDDIAVQPDGRILIGGSFTAIGGQPRECLARLNRDGSVDSSFVPPAGLLDDERSYVMALLLQEGNRAIVGGQALGSYGSVNVGGMFRIHLAETEPGCLPAPGGLVSWWPGEGSGADLAGGNVGTLVNEAAFAPGKVGQAFSFRGVNDRVALGDPENLRLTEAFTIEAWIKPESITGLAFIFLRGDTRYCLDPYYLALLPGGVVRLHIEDADSTTCGEQLDVEAVAMNQWQHVAGVFGHGAMKIYVNGALMAEKATVVRPFANLSATPSVWIGGERYQGLIDEPSVYKRALSAAEIQTIWAANSAGKCLPAQTAHPGSLDVTFDPTAGGQTIDFAAGGGAIHALALMPDGRLVLGGNFSGLAGFPFNNVARVHPDGAPDLGFQPGLGLDGEVYCLTRQADGHVLLGGIFTAVNGQARSLVARLRPDGSVDPTFAPRLAGASPDSPDWPYVSGIAVQADGKIVLGGRFTAANGMARTNLVRLNQDGSVDAAFAPVAVAASSYRLVTLALQADGKILVGGRVSETKAMVRLDQDGSLDVTFDARLQLSEGSPGWISSIAPLADGRVLVSGRFNTVDGTTRRDVARLFADGRLDGSFGTVMQAFDGSVLVGVAQPDGKVLLGGTFSNFGGVPRQGLLRLNEDGTLDAGFIPAIAEPETPRTSVRSLALRPDGHIWVAGWADNLPYLVRLRADGSRDTVPITSLVSAAPGEGFAGVRAIATQADGRVLVGGVFSLIGGAARTNLARLHPDGTLDPSFEAGLDEQFEVWTIAIQNDGRMLVGGGRGFIDPSGLVPYGVARLHPDGGLDSSFNPGTGPEGLTPVVRALLVQPDGRILVGGEFERFNGADRPGLVRLLPDGSLDEHFSPPHLDAGDENGIYALALQPDGKILLGGSLSSAAGVLRTHGRLNPDGTLDASFQPGTASGAVDAIALQPGGRILLGGRFSTIHGAACTNLVRLYPDGTLDTSFHGAADGIAALGVQPDGRILLGTLSGQLMRLHPDGRPDGSWTTELGPVLPYFRVSALSLQPDGQVLVGGDFGSVNGITRHAIARLNNDLTSPAPFVERDIASPFYAPTASSYEIVLHAHPLPGASVYAVQDRPPSGWGVNLISHEGVFDAATGQVKFGPFYDDIWRTLSYHVVPASSATTAQCFAGVGSTDGITTPIAGASCMFPARPHPADTQVPGWDMSIGEVTAYGAAWRRGQAWPQPPNPIPIDYVTRAGFLWRGGECYRMSAAFAHAPLWWVTCAGDTGTLAAAETVGIPIASAACVRALPPAFIPGEQLTVRISFTPAQPGVSYAVADRVPAGWTVTAISHGGELDPVSREVKWGPFLEDVARSLSYEATPPAALGDAVTFAGVCSLDGASQLISGPEELPAGCRLTVQATATPGVLRWGLSGQQGALFLIEASSDLEEWLPLTVVSNATRQLEFIDPGQGRFDHRFYRARPVR